MYMCFHIQENTTIVISCMCVASATYPMAEHECYAVKVINGDDINFVAH